MVLPRTVRFVSRLLAACAVLSALDALAGALAAHPLDTHRRAYLDAASRTSRDAGTVVPDVHGILVRAVAGARRAHRRLVHRGARHPRDRRVRRARRRLVPAHAGERERLLRRGGAPGLPGRNTRGPPARAGGAADNEKPARGG